MDSVENQLAEYIEISTPGLLFQVVNSLNEFIEKGLLIEDWGTCALKKIQPGKPWPDDIILIEFKTISGKTRYVLNYETYHGMGGVFKKITNSDSMKGKLL